MIIKQIGAAEHCGREAGQAYAFRLNAAVGVFDPLGLARKELTEIASQIQDLLNGERSIA